jgi:hypothetical protein
MHPDDPHSHSGSNSAANGWILGILGALLLYILSPGILVYYQRSGSPPPPPWVEKALSPLEWCYKSFKPVRKAYDAYFKLLSGAP